jgi:hypothetical protein
MACRALACLDLAWLVRSFFGLWDWFVTDSATTPHSGEASLLHSWETWLGGAHALAPRGFNNGDATYRGK